MKKGGNSQKQMIQKAKQLLTETKKELFTLTEGGEHSKSTTLTKKYHYITKNTATMYPQIPKLIKEIKSTDHQKCRGILGETQKKRKKKLFRLPKLSFKTHKKNKSTKISDTSKRRNVYDKKPSHKFPKTEKNKKCTKNVTCKTKDRAH